MISRSRKLSLKLVYQLTHQMMICRSKCRPLNRSSIGTNRCISSSSPASLAFAPEPVRARLPHLLALTFLDLSGLPDDGRTRAVEHRDLDGVQSDADAGLDSECRSLHQFGRMVAFGGGVSLFVFSLAAVPGWDWNKTADHVARAVLWRQPGARPAIRHRTAWWGCFDFPGPLQSAVSSRIVRDRNGHGALNTLPAIAGVGRLAESCGYRDCIRDRAGHPLRNLE